MSMFRKTYEVTGYVEDGAAFCPEHKPGGDPQPIFLGDEWEYAPTCDVCHEVIEVVALQDEEAN